MGMIIQQCSFRYSHHRFEHHQVLLYQLHYYNLSSNIQSNTTQLRDLKKKNENLLKNHKIKKKTYNDI